MSFKKCKDIILGIAMLAFGGVYTYFAQQIRILKINKSFADYAGARIIPTLLGILLMVLGLLCLIQGVLKLKKMKNQPKEAFDKAGTLAVVLTFACIVGYIMLLPELGFCLSTIIYLFLQMLVMAPKEKRNYVLFGIIAVVFTALVFVAFRVGLTQLLPRGIIESLLGF